jgi:hypothetical protein
MLWIPLRIDFCRSYCTEQALGLLCTLCVSPLAIRCRCEAVLCIAQRNFFHNPHHIAAVFTKVVRESGNGRYKARLAELGFAEACVFVGNAPFPDGGVILSRDQKHKYVAQLRSRIIVASHQLTEGVSGVMGWRDWG